MLQSIRSTTQICVVIRHQCGISVLVPRTSFHGETLVASRNVVCSSGHHLLWHRMPGTCYHKSYCLQSIYLNFIVDIYLFFIIYKTKFWTQLSFLHMLKQYASPIRWFSTVASGTCSCSLPSVYSLNILQS